ncbi:ComEA family DNA-binding protein [Georgenia sp. Z1491]|uniref:ComEA family DNA-binding protein n=1 Tax=Georgenia sp. Z1491 TaxID=3416707 RepID=UPI003CF60B0A
MDPARSEATRRLRDLTRVAYTAAAGHLEVDPEEGERRAVRAWPSRRAVVAVLVILALVVAALGARHLLSRPGPGEELAAGGHEEATASSPADAIGSDPAGAGADAGVAAADEGAADPDRSGSGVQDDPGAPDAVGGDPSAPGADGIGHNAGPVGGSGDGAGTDVVVHVAGAVARPGVVSLAPGSRVGDAVDAVGGARAEADLMSVNLARPLVDGEQVYVPVEGEEPREPPAGAQGAPPGAGDSSGATGGDATGGAGPVGAADGAQPIDLNTAGPGELETLPGIGPALAGRIVAHREQVGAFVSVEELQDVSGIGPVLMDQLRDLVTV